MPFSDYGTLIGSDALPGTTGGFEKFGTPVAPQQQQFKTEQELYQEELQKNLQQRSQTAQSWLPGPLRDVASAATGYASDVLGVGLRGSAAVENAVRGVIPDSLEGAAGFALRTALPGVGHIITATGTPEVSRFKLDLANDIQTASEEFDKAVDRARGDGKIAWARRMATGAARSIGNMATGALLGGPYGAVAMGGATEASQTYGEQERAGKSEAEQLGWATAAGLWESSVGAVMNKIGLGGAETIYKDLLKGVWKMPLKDAAKALLKVQGAEQLEEAITEQGHLAMRYANGQQKTYTWDDVLRTAIDTAGQTFLMTGGIQSHQQLQQWSKENPDKVPSRANWKKFGFPGTSTWKQRRQAAEEARKQPAGSPFPPELIVVDKGDTKGQNETPVEGDQAAKRMSFTADPKWKDDAAAMTEEISNSSPAGVAGLDVLFDKLRAKHPMLTRKDFNEYMMGEGKSRLELVAATRAPAEVMERDANGNVILDRNGKPIPLAHIIEDRNNMTSGEPARYEAVRPRRQTGEQAQRVPEGEAPQLNPWQAKYPEQPTANAPKEPISQRSIIDKVKRLFGSVIKWGQTPKGTLGIYSRNKDRMRTAKGYEQNISVISHELAHQIMGDPNTFSLKQAAANNPQLDAELYAADYYDGHDAQTATPEQVANHQSEGWSEFIRMWNMYGDGEIDGWDLQKFAKARRQGRTINRNTVQELLPNLWNYFNTQFAREHPREYAGLQEVHKDMLAYAEQGAEMRVAGNTADMSGPVGDPIETIIKLMKSDRLESMIGNKAAMTVARWQYKLARAILTDQFTLKLLERQVKLNKPGYYNDFVSAWAIADIDRSAKRDGAQAASNGVFIKDPNGLYEQVARKLGIFVGNQQKGPFWTLGAAPLRAVFEVVDHDEYQAKALPYIKAKHAQGRVERLMQKTGKTKGELWGNWQNGLTQSDAETILRSATPEQKAKYEQVYQIISEVNNDILRAMMITGSITPDAYKVMMDAYKNIGYIPMLHHGQWNKLVLHGRGPLNMDSFLMMREEAMTDAPQGRDTEIIDPIDATLMRMNAMYEQMNARNRFMGVAMETSPEFRKMLTDKGVNIGVDSPIAGGMWMEVLSEKRQFKKFQLKLEQMMNKLRSGDAPAIDDVQASMIYARDKFLAATPAERMQTRGLWKMMDRIGVTYKGKKLTPYLWKKMVNDTTQPSLAEKLVNKDLALYMAENVPSLETLYKFMKPDYRAEMDNYVFPVTFWGDKLFVEMNPVLFEELRNESVPDGFWAKLMGVWSRIVKGGAVRYNLSFAVMNPFKDTGTYLAQTTSDEGAYRLEKIFTNIYHHALANIQDSAVEAGWMKRPAVQNRDESRQAYQTLVGNIGSLSSYTSEEYAKHLAMPGQKKRKNIFFQAGKVLDVITEVTAGTDVGPRALEFDNAMKEFGYDKVNGQYEKDAQHQNLPDKPPQSMFYKAAIRALEVTTPFHRGGWLTKGFERNGFVFFQAAVSSRYTQYKAIKRLWDKAATPKERAIAKKRLGAFVAGASLVSLLYLLLRGDDDDYKEAPAWLRNKYWFFNIGGNPVRIAKPYDWAFIPNFMEAAWNSLADKDRKSMREFLAYEISNADPTGFVGSSGPSLKLTPPDVALVTPVVETLANRDFFRDKDIESMHDKTLQVKDRGAEKASLMARTASAWGLDKVGLSPVKIDHLMESMTGGMGERIAKADLASFIGWRSLVMKKEYRQSVQEFYEDVAERQLKLNSMRANSTDATWTEGYGEMRILERQKELYTELWKYSRDLTDEKERDKIDRYLVFMSREALGKEQLDRYENFWTADLPAPLAAARRDFRQYVVSKRNSDPPSKKSDVDRSYKETHGKWRSTRKAAADWVTRHASD